MKTKLSKKTVLVLFVILSIFLLGNPVTMAEFIFGDAVNMDSPLNSASDDAFISITPDGLTACFSSTRPGGYGSDDIWMVTRSAKDEPWGQAVNLGESVNTSASEAYPSLSSDGLTLFFSEMLNTTVNKPIRAGGVGGRDLWMVTRPNADSDWGIPTNLGPVVNSTSDDLGPCISSDGMSLYFFSNRPGGSGLEDIWVTTRPSISSPWEEPVNLGPNVNDYDLDGDISLSPDELTLFFVSWGRSGSLGRLDIWFMTRASEADPWDQPQNMGMPVNTSGTEGAPFFYAGGPSLIFTAYARPGHGGFDFWEMPITPIVDFDGDGKVDSADVCKLIDHWQTDYPACDIAPAPFGDGIVDIKDLKVLAEHLLHEVDDPTLIAHWPLDETEGAIVADAVAGNQAYALGDPLWQPEGGQVGGALLFDGVDDFVSAPAVLNPSDGPFSVLVWVQGGAPGQGIISENGRPNWLSLDPLTGHLMTELTESGRAGGPLLSPAIIDDGNWHRVGFVWDGLNRILCVDDGIVTQDTQDGLESLGNGLYIGCGDPMQPGTFFSGLIDDVRIYTRAVKP